MKECKEIKNNEGANIRERYTQLCKKYSLPSFDELDREFEISSIDEKENILSAIRRKIENKIENFLKILHIVIEPDTTISDLHECRDFNEDEKAEAFELFKQLMIIKRESELIEIDPNEKMNADFIINVYKEWKPIKTKMTAIVSKMKNSWKKEFDFSGELGYLG
ncbi:MAG: hypothetical protein N3D84_00335 [Candidatus Woesearchaeota archaeon]|nr:hypothetical protein [Candidatus Woesearchaeota archaeon]